MSKRKVRAVALVLGVLSASSPAWSADEAKEIDRLNSC